MAWKYPKHRLQKFQPTSIDEINSNMAQVAQESGRLNEHNWQREAVSDKSSLATTASTQIRGTYRSIDPIDSSLGDPFWVQVGSAMAIPSYCHTVVGNIDWVIIDSISISTENSLIWINASFQQVKDMILGTPTAAQYALRINGAIIHESMTGTADRSNDRFASWPNYTVPIVLDAIVPAPTGTHTIDLVTRTTHGSEFMGATSVFGKIVITNRELFAVELRR